MNQDLRDSLDDSLCSEYGYKRGTGEEVKGGVI